MNRTQLLDTLNTLEFEKIKLNIYSGFSFLHIDVIFNDTPVLWSTIMCEENISDNEILELKIVEFKEDILNKEEKELVLNALINISKSINISRIFGRIKINEYNISKSFYENLGFNILHTPNDKFYDSAKIYLFL